MTAVSILDVARALRDFETRYRWLDIFADQVRELVSPSSDVYFFDSGSGQYRVELGEYCLDLRIYLKRGVARWSLSDPQYIAEGRAVPRAALGALIGSEERSR